MIFNMLALSAKLIKKTTMAIVEVVECFKKPRFQNSFLNRLMKIWSFLLHRTANRTTHDAERI